MEAAVIELDGVNGALLALVNHKFVVQTELALRRSRKVCTHEYVAIDVGAEDRPCSDVSRLNENIRGAYPLRSY